MLSNKIIYLHRKDIDTSKWDDCISHSVNALIYGFSWYLDIVSPEWSALVINDYDAVMPLTCRKKWGINYLCQPFFMQQGGVFSKIKLTQQITDAFVNAIPSVFRFIDININESQSEFNFNTFQLRKRKNILLSLQPSYEALQKNYAENCIRNIKKTGSNLHLTKSMNPDTIIHLFRNNRGAELSNIKNSDYKRLELLAKTLIERDCGEILEVKKEDLVIAGAILAKDKHRITFLFSGMDNAFKDDRPMFFLINEVIKKYAGQHLLFDFEGSENESLARFYKGFGAYETSYLNLKRNDLPLLFKWFKK